MTPAYFQALMERHLRREVIDDAHYAILCLMQSASKSAKLDDFMVRKLLGENGKKPHMVSQSEFVRMVSAWLKPKA